MDGHEPEPPDNFDAILSHWYPIQALNRAMQAMQAFQDIQPFVLPHT